MVIDVLDHDMAQGRLVEPRRGVHGARGAHFVRHGVGSLLQTRMYKCMNKGPKGL
jgi:hypothetical protein